MPQTPTRPRRRTRGERAPSSMPQVKICGLTNLPDAELAAGLGAWALGHDLLRGQPAPVLARAGRARSPPRCAGGSSSAACSSTPRSRRSCAISEELGLTLVQLHGDEGPAFCAEVARRTGARIIKAAQVAGPGDVRDLERFHVDFHLLDARVPRPPRARDARRHGRDLRLGARRGPPLEGPADPQRRPDTPRTSPRRSPRTRPYAVDSASGTESSPGHKDLEQAARRSSPPSRAHGRRTEARHRGRRPSAHAAREPARDCGAGVSATEPAIEHRFGPYGGQFVPETLMPALAELEQAWGEARDGPRLPRRARRRCCGTSPGARRRSTAPAGSPSASGGPSTSSARTSTTPARTSSTTRSARCCSRGAWASAA